MFAYQYCLSLGLFAGHSTFVLSTKLSKSLKKTICDTGSEQKYCNGLTLSLQQHEKNTSKAIVPCRREDVLFLQGLWLTLTTDLLPAPLKLRPYGAIQIWLLLLLLLLLCILMSFKCQTSLLYSRDGIQKVFVRCKQCKPMQCHGRQINLSKLSKVWLRSTF